MPSKTSLSVRIKAYTEALELRRKYGWGNRTIAAHVGLPYPTVNSWMVGRHSPFGSCNVPRLGPSRPLSYLAGALLGDGSLIRSPSYHYEMRFRVRDLEFAERVCDCAISVLRKQKSVKLDNKGFYEVRFWSRLLYEYLSDWSQIRKCAGEFPAEFVRGFADAEGSPAVSLWQSSSPMFGFYVVLVSTNLRILHYIKDLLQTQFGIGSYILLGRKRRSMWSKRPWYYLKIGRRQDQLRFARRIGFGLYRKQQKMEIALSLLETRSLSQAASEWRKLFQKHGRNWVFSEPAKKIWSPGRDLNS